MRGMVTGVRIISRKGTKTNVHYRQWTCIIHMNDQYLSCVLNSYVRLYCKSFKAPEQSAVVLTCDVT